MPRKTTKRTARHRKTPAATGSLVPAKYREAYQEHGGSSGDKIALHLKKHVAADDGSVDLAKLRALARPTGSGGRNTPR